MGVLLLYLREAIRTRLLVVEGRVPSYHARRGIMAHLGFSLNF